MNDEAVRLMLNISVSADQIWWTLKNWRSLTFLCLTSSVNDIESLSMTNRKILDLASSDNSGMSWTLPLECSWVDIVSPLSWLTMTVEHEAVSHPEVVHVIDGITKPVEHVNGMGNLILRAWEFIWHSRWPDPIIRLPWVILWLTEHDVETIMSLTDREQRVEVSLKVLEAADEVPDIAWMIAPLLRMICHLRLDETLEQAFVSWRLGVDPDLLHDTLQLLIFLSWLHLTECMTNNWSLRIIVELLVLDVSNSHALHWLGNLSCRFIDCIDGCLRLRCCCHSGDEGDNWGWQRMQHLRAIWLYWVWDGCQARWLR